MTFWGSLRTRILAGAVACVAVLAAVVMVALDTLVADELERDSRREAATLLASIADVLEPGLAAGDTAAVRTLALRLASSAPVIGLAVFDGRGTELVAAPDALRSDPILGRPPGAEAPAVALDVGDVPVVAAGRPVTRGGEVVGRVWLAIDRRPAEQALGRFRTFAALLMLGILGVTLMLSTVAAEALVRPLDALSDSVASLARGEGRGGEGAGGPQELRRLGRRVRRMAEQLAAARAALTRLAGDLDRLVHERTKELEAANRRLGELAHTDPLTGLANRRGLEIELERYISLSHRHRQPLAVVMMDLDAFKRYNDACGHLAGDSVLRTVAAALLGQARASDVVARWGGDEFCIVVPGADGGGALTAARRFIVAVLEAMADLSRPDVAAVLGASAGVACYPEDGEQGPVLVARADAALYRAKAAGGNAVLRLESVAESTLGA